MLLLLSLFYFGISSFAGQTMPIVALYDQAKWQWGTAENRSAWMFFNEYKSTNSCLDILSFDAKAVHQNPPINRESYFKYLQNEGIGIGSLPLGGEQLVTTGNRGHHLYENGYGDFAWDIVKLGANKKTYKAQGLNNSDYYVWGENVFLPTAGEVVHVERSRPDNAPNLEAAEESDQLPAYEESNQVVVKLKGNFYLALMHFKEGSIPLNIKKGMHLKEGTYLGQVGNSGVSYVPHLHMTMYWWDTKRKRWWSVPSQFANINIKNVNSLEPAAFYDFVVPEEDSLISGP